MDRAKKRICRAAVTVEASFLVPWAVLITALLIILLFFVHDRVWFRAAALETALSGNQYISGSAGNGRAGLWDGADGEDRAGYAAAMEKGGERIADQVMPGTGPQITVSCTNEVTQVRFEGKRYPMFAERSFWTVDEMVRKVRPVPVVRGAWIVKALAEGWTDSAETDM